MKINASCSPDSFFIFFNITRLIVILYVVLHSFSISISEKYSTYIIILIPIIPAGQRYEDRWRN